ncbi:MAG: HEAT repeat domain-containing protein [Planctomycetota bacterium]|jgi:HEAT repeat protein
MRNALFLMVLGVSAGLAACGPDEVEPAHDAPLPGVEPGNEQWFWRDVLAAPFPGEAGADDAALAHAEPAARIDALDALAESGDERAPATLMAALRDPQIAVAAVAAHDLGVHGYERAIPRLLAGIGPYPIDYDVPIEVRAAQAAALAQLRNPAGVPLILSILAEDSSLATDEADLQWDRTPRMAFTQELALPGLVALAGTDFGFMPTAPVPAREESVRAAHAWWEERRLALWEAAPVTDPALVARVEVLVAQLDAYQLRQVDGARFVLAQLGPGVLPFLIDALDSDNDYVRLHSLEVMQRLVRNVDRKTRDRIASAATAPLLEDMGGGVAAKAADVIGECGSADALIIALQRRDEPDVLVAVIDALGRTRLPAAAAALSDWEPAETLAALADVRVARHAALLAIDPAADAEPFLALLGSPDASVAFAALDRLIALTGSDCGYDPASTGSARESGLAAARRALAERASG